MVLDNHDAIFFYAWTSLQHGEVAPQRCRNCEVKSLQNWIDPHNSNMPHSNVGINFIPFRRFQSWLTFELMRTSVSSYYCYAWYTWNLRSVSIESCIPPQKTMQKFWTFSIAKSSVNETIFIVCLNALLHRNCIINQTISDGTKVLA